MATFTPISSSSKGNCYLISSAPGVPALLVELGVPVRKVREKIGFNLGGLAGALVSHCHGDHSSAVKEMLKATVDVYTSPETAEALGVGEHHRIHELITGETITIGAWTVLPFDLHHDVPTHGFFIGAPDGDKLLFIPDTSYIRNRFEGINILCIECNHISDILSANIVGGHLPISLGHRVRRNHMSLESVIGMLKANDLSRCREIWLLHLSAGNSDEARMIRAVQEATGIPCRACEE
jgi:phosphoribosyl 1,2-cyclic phosphodiesterase